MKSGLFLSVGFILVASFLILGSISGHLLLLHLAWTMLGVGVVVFLWFMDWRVVFRHPSVIYALYGVALALLVFVLLKGPVIRNVKSWIVVGPFSFQPVELMKIALIFLYAHFFSRRHAMVAHVSTILLSLAAAAVPALLTAAQPALGSAIILLGIWFGFLLLSGLPMRRLALLCLAFAAIGILAWSYGLRDYQKQRIRAVFYPQHETLGVNYSAIQSKIAIGSAGFLGKGYAQGSQTQLGFLTEPESDFVFAAFIEEWGWLGGILVVAAFAMLVFSILKIGMRVNVNFEKFLCVGTAMVFMLQFFLNAGSTTGLLPVVGVTFPFLSYGGTSLLTNFALLGIVNSIRRGS
jgi:rod shape determining protein RodA